MDYNFDLTDDDCSDSADDVESGSLCVNDTTPPTIVRIITVGSGRSITTSEQSVCTTSTSSNLSGGSTMTTTDGITHRVATSVAYYVQCEDTRGNRMPAPVRVNV